jgi:hypothetical protein
MRNSLIIYLSPQVAAQYSCPLSNLLSHSATSSGLSLSKGIDQLYCPQSIDVIASLPSRTPTSTSSNRYPASTLLNPPLYSQPQTSQPCRKPCSLPNDSPPSCLKAQLLNYRLSSSSPLLGSSSAAPPPPPPVPSGHKLRSPAHYGISTTLSMPRHRHLLPRRCRPLLPPARSSTQKGI